MSNRALGQPQGALVQGQHVGNSIPAQRASLTGAGGIIPGAGGYLNGPVNLTQNFSYSGRNEPALKQTDNNPW